MPKIDELFKVEGLSVVITGGASGIGKAYAEAMAVNGAKVALFDIDPEGLAKAKADLRGSCGKVDTFVLDATDGRAIAAAMDQVVSLWGRIDVVFANVGISGGPGYVDAEGNEVPARALENLDPALLDRVLDVNVGATFKTMQACIPHMKASGGGRIIVTSSISATRTEMFVGAPYVVSKGGVGMLVKQAARELAPHGILVNAIAPGPVITNIGGGRLKDPDARAPFDELTPIGRIAAPEDLHGAALFLASPASSYLAGAEIIVDGGAILGAHGPARQRA